jgi:hypothetical protein
VIEIHHVISLHVPLLLLFHRWGWQIIFKRQFHKVVFDHGFVRLATVLDLDRPRTIQEPRHLLLEHLMEILLLLLLLGGFNLAHLEGHLLGQQAWIVRIVRDHVVGSPLGHASKETWDSISGCNQVGDQLATALRAFMTF